MDPYLYAYYMMLIIGGGYLVFAAFTGQLGMGDHGTDHGGADLGHGDMHVEVGHGDAHAELGHGDASVDAHADGGHAGHGGGEFSGDVVGLLSPLIWATFMAMTGIAGIMCEGAGLHGPLNILPSGLVGFLLAMSAMFGMNAIARKIQSSAHILIAETTNLEAEVITPIPADGVGEVAYTARGIRRTGPARSRDGKNIPKGTQVVIIEHSENYFQVRPTVDERLRLLGQQDAVDSVEESTAAECEAQVVDSSD